MINTFLIALISLLDFQDNGHYLSITASDNDLRLNEPLKIEVRSEPVLDPKELEQLEKELATQKNEGLLLFFLSAKDSTTLTLLPQFAGHFTLTLSPIKFEGSPREISPFPFSVEAFPLYEAALLPAPPMPLESRDPLELDEANKRKLSEINAKDDPTVLLKERSVSFSNWLALIIGVGLLYLLYLLASKPIIRSKPKPINRNEALERLALAKTLPKRQGAEAIYTLLIQYIGESSRPAFIEILNQWRFQQSDPSTDEWQAMVKAVERFMKI